MIGRASLAVMMGLLGLPACGGGSAPGPVEAEVVARVQTSPLQRRAPVEELAVYGTVVPGPQARHTSSVPFESVVTAVPGLSRALVSLRAIESLGLTLSRRLADLMGGEIAAQSSAGIGSRFTVRLPRHLKPSGETPTP